MDEEDFFAAVGECVWAAVDGEDMEGESVADEIGSTTTFSDDLDVEAPSTAGVDASFAFDILADGTFAVDGSSAVDEDGSEEDGDAEAAWGGFASEDNVSSG